MSRGERPVAPASQRYARTAARLGGRQGRPEFGCAPGLAPGMSEGMPGFSLPTSRVRLSLIAAMEGFRAEGRGSATDDTMLGREIRDFGLDWQDPGRFEAYTSYLRDQ